MPGLKPRAAEVVGMVGSLEQKEEFSLATLVAETGEVEQPRDSMFPAVKVILGHLVTKTPPPSRSSSRPAWTDPSQSTPRLSTIPLLYSRFDRRLLFFRGLAVAKFYPWYITMFVLSQSCPASTGGTCRKLEVVPGVWR